MPPEGHPELARYPSCNQSHEALGYRAAGLLGTVIVLSICFLAICYGKAKGPSVARRLCQWRNL